MIISDDRVFPLYGEKVKDSLNDYVCHSLVLPHGGAYEEFSVFTRKFMKLY